jgi:hypothetical protein
MSPKLLRPFNQMQGYITHPILICEEHQLEISRHESIQMLILVVSICQVAQY